MFLLHYTVLVITFAFVSGGCSDVSIISRSEWRAQRPRGTSTLRTPVSKFFVHHTDTSWCSSVVACSYRVRKIQNYHMNTKHWHDIGYNFLVGGDGNVYEGRGWDRIGCHAGRNNVRSLGVAIIGDFEKMLPNSKALAALQNLLLCGVERNKLTRNYRLYGHRDVSSTSCPGNKLYSKIKTWPHYRRNRS